MADIPLISTGGAATNAPQAAANTINPTAIAVNLFNNTTIPAVNAAIAATNANVATNTSAINNGSTGNAALAAIVNDPTTGNAALGAGIAAIGGVKTSALASANLPLTGSEIVEVVQSIAGVLTNVKTTCGAINPSSKPIQYVDPRDYNGWDPTGNNGISSIMQTALAQALANNFQVRIPPGLYVIDTPIDIGVNVDDGPQIIGISPPNNLITSQFVLQPHGADVIFKSALTDKPAFYNSHRLRGAYLANFSIIGPNNLVQTKPINDFKQNYNPLGLRDSQYSPCCGLALDSFSSVGVPADGGYPGMSAKYTTTGGSSNLIFDNVSIQAFVVNWTIGLTGAQADTIIFRNCVAALADTGVAVGNSQSKDANWWGGSIVGCRQAWDGVNYGPGTGFPMNTLGVNYGFLMRIFNYQHGNAPLIASMNYFESVRSFGNFGTGSSTFRGHGTWQGGSCTIDTLNSLPPPILFETYGLWSFRDLNLQATSTGGALPLKTWNFCSDLLTPIKIDNCTISNDTGSSGAVPFVGTTTNGSNGVRLDNCLSDGGFPSQPLSDDSPIDVSAFTITNRFSGTPRSGRYANGTGIVDFTPPTVSCVASVAATGTSIDTLAITFTGSLALGATTGTLTGAWTGPTSWFMVTFSNADVRPALFKAGSATVNWDNWGLSSGATASATALGVTMTFTATDVTLVQIGDIYFWKIIKQYSGSTQRSVPAWIVTNIVGSVVTCQALYDVTFYDTVANNGGGTTLQTPQYVWAPSGSALTCSMNNSTTITVVSPITVLKNGDWVTGTNLAANSRVVSGGGTATVVLNKATTGGSLSAQPLWFGRLNTPTLTATW